MRFHSIVVGTRATNGRAVSCIFWSATIGRCGIFRDLCARQHTFELFLDFGLGWGGMVGWDDQLPSSCAKVDKKRNGQWSYWNEIHKPWGELLGTDQFRTIQFCTLWGWVIFPSKSIWVNCTKRRWMMSHSVHLHQINTNEKMIQMSRRYCLACDTNEKMI